MIALTRCYALPAAHVLSHPSLSADDNERIYGKCANPAGHGHDYGLEITVTGPVDPVTGRIFDPDALDAIVRERVLSRFAYRRLNDDPAFRERVPTAENIAVPSSTMSSSRLRSQHTRVCTWCAYSLQETRRRSSFALRRAWNERRFERSPQAAHRGDAEGVRPGVRDGTASSARPIRVGQGHAFLHPAATARTRWSCSTTRSSTSATTRW